MKEPFLVGGIVWGAMIFKGWLCWLRCSFWASVEILNYLPFLVSIVIVVVREDFLAHINI